MADDAVPHPVCSRFRGQTSAKSCRTWGPPALHRTPRDAGQLFRPGTPVVAATIIHGTVSSFTPSTANMAELNSYDRVVRCLLAAHTHLHTCMFTPHQQLTAAASHSPSQPCHHLMHAFLLCTLLAPCLTVSLFSHFCSLLVYSSASIAIPPPASQNKPHVSSTSFYWCLTV